MGVARTSVGTAVSGAAGITVLPGAGAQVGDYGIIIVETANQAMSPPSGWGQQVATAGFGTAGAAGASKLTVFSKNAIDSTDIGTGVALGDSGDHQIAVFLTYSGVDPNAVGGNTPVSQSTATTSVTTNGVVAANVRPGWIFLAVIATDRDSATVSTNTSPAWSNVSNSNSFIVNVSTSTGAGGGIIVNELLPSAPATANTDFSCQITSSAFTSWVMGLGPLASPPFRNLNPLLPLLAR